MCCIGCILYPYCIGFTITCLWLVRNTTLLLILWTLHKLKHEFFIYNLTCEKVSSSVLSSEGFLKGMPPIKKHTQLTPFCNVSAKISSTLFCFSMIISNNEYKRSLMHHPGATQWGCECIRHISTHISPSPHCPTE